MADGYVQVPADSVGKKVDTNEIATSSGTVERQRVEIPGTVQVSSDLLAQILTELQLHSIILADGLGIKDNLQTLRDELNAQRDNISS